MPQIKALVDQGLERHRIGDIDNALAAYARALTIDPGNAEASYYCGIALHQAGRSGDGIAHLETAVAAASDDASYHFDLANLREANGRLDLAEASFRRAIELDPGLTDAHYNLGNNLLAQGRFDEAIDVYQQTLRLSPDHAKAHSNLGNALQSLGRLEEAEAAYARTLELNPLNHAVRHMLAALRGETVPKPPAEFVSRLFDRYAPRFEAHVTKALEYRVPLDLRDGLVEILGPDFRFDRVADLGAGTGLCGVALRDHAEHLTAIDISRNMLRAAKSKSVYDSIIIGDIVEILNTSDRQFDLFVAADVLIYVGALEGPFAAISKRSRENAYLAFSIERTDDADYVLQRTGRYAHSVDYISRMADTHCFEIALQRPVNIRKEKTGMIAGVVFVLRSVR